MFGLFRSAKRGAVGRTQDVAKGTMNKGRYVQNQATKRLDRLQNRGEKFFRDRRQGASRFVGDRVRGARYVASRLSPIASKYIRGETTKEAENRRKQENKNRQRQNAKLGDKKTLLRQERARQTELSRLKTNRKYGLNRRRTEEKYRVKNGLKQQFSSFLNKYTTFEIKRMGDNLSKGISMANVLQLPLENVLMKNRLNKDELGKMKILVNNMKREQDVNDLKLLYNKLPAELKVQNPTNNRQELAKHIKNALPRGNTASQQLFRRITSGSMNEERTLKKLNEEYAAKRQQVTRIPSQKYVKAFTQPQSVVVKQPNSSLALGKRNEPMQSSTNKVNNYLAKPTPNSNKLNTAPVIKSYQDVNRIIDNAHKKGPVELPKSVMITNVKDVETVIRYLIYKQGISLAEMKSIASDYFYRNPKYFESKEHMRVRLLRQYA